MSRPRRAAMPTLLLALAAVLMAGCGLSHDDEAQPIAADKLPADLLAPSQPATSTTLPPSDTKPVTIYLLRGTSRSEEHTSELQSLLRIAYAVFFLKKKKKYYIQQHQYNIEAKIN